jgi:tRNA(adenine34) deaminase
MAEKEIRKIRKTVVPDEDGDAVDRKYMREAVRQAKKAAALGDVPIGCVIVYQGTIIGRGYNRRMADKTALAHAEIIAIRKACKKMGDWRLEDCTMYVTLEPCPMCAGAIVQARIPRVVIGCMNAKAGCAGSVLDMLHEDGFNHQAETRIGVMQEECSQMLSEFFRQLREKQKAKQT